MSSKSNVYIVGVPYEGKKNVMGGTSLAPTKIRWGLEMIEDFSVYKNKEIPPYKDLGDLNFRSFYELLEGIENFLSSFPSESKFLFLGGDHTISLPIVKHFSNLIEEVVVFHFDAHLDRREEYEGELTNNATVIRRIEEVVGSGNVYSFGIRSRAPGESKGNSFFYSIFPHLGEVIEKIGRKKIYLTIDFDVIDPSEFPAVTNPEPGGISFKELVRAIGMLEGRILGADLVEFNPKTSGDTFPAVTAAAVVREVLIALR